MSPSTSPSAPADAARDLYAQHHGWLQGWLRRRLGCSHQAADLAQDTFVLILASRQAAAIQEPRAYLATVARGLLANWYKRQALERAYLDALAAMPEALARAPEERALVLETLHRVDAMLDTLAPAAREAFLLSQLDGLKYEDIAQRLGVSLSTVKRYMAQGFRQCLACMEV